MTHLRSVPLCLACLLIFWPVTIPPGDAARAVNTLADEYWGAYLQAFPLAGMFLGAPDAPADRMGDNSLAAVRAWEQKEDRWISRLKEIPAEALRGRAEDATYGVLLETLEASRQSRICRPELLPLNQQGGWQIFLPVIGQIQPLGTAELRKQAWHAGMALPDTSTPRSSTSERVSGWGSPSPEPMQKWLSVS